MAQIALILGIAIGGWWVVTTVQENLAAHDLGFGFDFLGGRAGFTVGSSLIPFEAGSSILQAFFAGLANTMAVALVAIPLATLLGLVLGTARVGPNWALSRLAGFYVETVRNIPPLLQLFFWYFIALRALPPPRDSMALFGTVLLNNRGLYLPSPAGVDAPFLLAGMALVVLGLLGFIASRRRAGQGGSVFFLVLFPLIGVAAWAIGSAWSLPALRGFNVAGGMKLSPEFLALTGTLSLYQAAYVAETIRSGLNSVPPGQYEVSEALGLSRGQALRLVIIPQALRVALPPLATIYVNTVKGSTIAAAIAYPDLVSIFAGTVLNLTGKAIEIMLIVGAVYLTISLGIAALVYRYEVSRARWNRA